MKVFVSGVAGFIGSYVARALINRGDDVVGCDNFNDYYPRRCKEFNLDLINLTAHRVLQYIPEKEILPVFSLVTSYYPKRKSKKLGGFNFVEADITNYDFIRYLFSKEKPEAVIHVAAVAGIPQSVKKPRLYTSVNVDGTVNLLEASQNCGVKKFVFTSSSSVYGNREQGRVAESDEIVYALSPYGATKVAGEVLCYTYNEVSGISMAIARIFGPVYGPFQRPYGMLVQRAINYASNGKTLTMYGLHGLATKKDTTYIDDVVDGLIRCLDKSMSYEVFNLGTANPCPNSTVIKEIERLLGKKVKIDIVKAGKGETQVSANIAKAKKILGYRPKMKVAEGVKRQVEVYLKMPKWYQEMENV